MDINNIRGIFKARLLNEMFTEDRNGGKTIELIGASFLADEDAIFGKPNHDYIDAELDWYESGSTNINDIYADEHGRRVGKPPPAAWKMSANVHGEINSNYGHLIHSGK